MATLLMPTEDDQAVEFPSGQSLAVASVRDSAIGYQDLSVQWTGDSPEFQEPRISPRTGRPARVRIAPEWEYEMRPSSLPGFAPAPAEGDESE